MHGFTTIKSTMRGDQNISKNASSGTISLQMEFVFDRESPPTKRYCRIHTLNLFLFLGDPLNFISKKSVEINAMLTLDIMFHFKN